jgi:hypothetical protein
MRRILALAIRLGLVLGAVPFAQEGQPALVGAAGRGDIAAVRSLLAGGANPNEVDNSGVYKGWTPLMAAARGGHADIVRLLLKAHANVNATNEYGGTALDIAVSNNGESSTVAGLIEAAGGRGRRQYDTAQPTTAPATSTATTNKAKGSRPVAASRPGAKSGTAATRKGLLVGTWQSEDLREITLNADGTCEMPGVGVVGTKPGEPLITTYAASDGTWTLDGATLTLTCHGELPSSPWQVDNSPEKFEIIKIDATKMTLKSTRDGSIQERTKLQ